MHLETQSLKVCCKFIAKFSASGGRKSPGPLPGSAPGPVADSRGAYAPKPQNVQLPLYVPIPKSKMLSASGSQAPWDPQPRGTFGFGSERKYPSLYWLQNRENKAFSCFQWMLESSKAFSFRRASPPWPPDQGFCRWTPLGAPSPDPRYRLALHALAMCPSQTQFLDPPVPLRER